MNDRVAHFINGQWSIGPEISPTDWIADAFIAGASLVAAIILLILLRKILRNSFVYIQNTSYGIVERKWSTRRRPERFGLITLTGNAGFLPEVIRGGWHFFTPFQYKIHKFPLITIDQIAYLIARVGAPLGEGQALGEWPAGVGIDDARGFLENGGQRGPQRRIIRSGTYAINTALFCVVTDDDIFNIMDASPDDRQLQAILKTRQGFLPIVIENDTIGIITVQDGPGLQHGEIIAPTVGTDSAQADLFHNSFQDITKFLAAGGRRGRQEQVLVDGTYYVNRLFATVEVLPKTRVEIGMVGVINSYVGPDVSTSLTADGGRGRTVDVGSRGIWSRPFEPGKYALNTYAMEITQVPTTNFQLRWMEGSSAKAPGGVSYDDDLKEIPVITSDAFEVLVPLSIVAHISPMNAPHVIQRFSRIQRLVNQTLDPFISSYFKDAAQSRTMLEFIQKRAEIGTAALQAMKTRLAEHKIDIEEIMLGTPKAPGGDDRMESLLDQLRQRQLAVEQQQTFAIQEEAAHKQRSLNETRAKADQQIDVTRSALAVTIAENTGMAETARQTQAAAGTRVTAEAEAYAIRVRAEAIGGPENVIRQLALETLSRAVKESQMPLVPSVLVQGAAQGQGGSLIDALLAMIAKNEINK